MWPGPPTGLSPCSWSHLERTPGWPAWEYQGPSADTHVPISLPHVNQQQPVVDEGAWPSGRGGLATTLCSWFGLPLRPPSIEKGTTPAAGIIAPESSLWREQFENPHLESQKDGTEQRCGPLSPLVWPGMHPPPSRADGGARSLPARAARMATMQQDLPELVDIKR